ncbi:MAG: hypothetical protein R3B90_18545 [Planctomycetaceae bacterium]
MAAGPVRAGFGMLIVLAVALHWLHRTQPDWAVAIAVIPPWWWTMFAAIALVLFRGRRGEWLWRGAVIAWSAFVVLSVPETWSLARHAGRLVVPADEPDGQALRIATLNCHLGDSRTVDDLLALDVPPDLILLQESPGAAAIERLARSLYSNDAGFLAKTGTSYVMGGDCSIVARGKLEAVDAPSNARYRQAVWTRSDRTRLHVFSLRLSPPPIRVDWWNPQCWQDHRARRESHRTDRTVDGRDPAPTGE